MANAALRGGILKWVLGLALCALLCSWGSTGHYQISYRTKFFFPTVMSGYTHWADSLAKHASDADARKAWDAAESPRHYIDLENFPGFISNGSIIQDVDSAYATYGSNFLYYNGSLPYTTLRTFDSLVKAFEDNNLQKVIYFASDLGHYVADGHMPLHLTRNYDGQYTDQDGVHYRIETRLVNTYISQINYTGEPVYVIPDVEDYVFDYIYNNYLYVDSLLDADSIAYEQTGSHSSNQFYSVLWAGTSHQMNYLFKNASLALTELIYTAWIRAGSPSSIFLNASGDGCFPEIYPNPAFRELNIRFGKTPSDPCKIFLMDSEGRLAACVASQNRETALDLVDVPPGTYYLMIEGTTLHYVKKIVIIQ